MYLGNQIKADTELRRLPEEKQPNRAGRRVADKLRASGAILLAIPLSLMLWGVLYLIWKLIAALQ